MLKTSVSPSASVAVNKPETCEAPSAIDLATSAVEGDELGGGGGGVVSDELVSLMTCCCGGAIGGASDFEEPAD